MKKIQDLKPGDKVTRYLSSAMIPIPMKVKEITDKWIVCVLEDNDDPELHWEFHPVTGGEIDELLGFDGIHFTGSAIKPREEP